ncbi:MAG TPA: hypothetical protein VFZ34_05640 [Blastocatellia bacterium]|nr:hypothetical protein [Blastocatellia bacterium]
MSGQTITIRGTASDCWYISRSSSDEAHVRWQSIEDAWFDALEMPWVMAYQKFSGPDVCPIVPYQFVLRCSPIVC